jgi:hypothetical protein
MTRSPYHCPNCSQTSPRRWNMKVHIKRKHKGLGKPFKSGSGSHFNETEFIPSHTSKLRGNDSHNYGHYSHDRTDQGYHKKYPDNIDPSELGSNDMKESISNSKGRDPTSELFETFRQMIEIKNMVNRDHPNSPKLSAINYMLHLYNMRPQSRLRDSLNSYFSILNILNDNKNIGFRGHICYNCYNCWVDPVYSNSEEMKSLIQSTRPSPHTCDPKKVSDAQNVQDIQSKKNESQNMLINLLQSLVIICWSYFGQRKVHLQTEELTSPASSSPTFDPTQRQNNNYPANIDNNNIEQELRSQQEQQTPSSFWIKEKEEIENNCNSIDIDLAKIENKHWAYRAIKETLYDGKSSIVIDSMELVDFVKTAKATFGTSTVDINGSIHNFFMYLSFRSNNI